MHSARGEVEIRDMDTPDTARTHTLPRAHAYRHNAFSLCLYVYLHVIDWVSRRVLPFAFFSLCDLMLVQLVGMPTTAKLHRIEPDDSH